MKIVTLKGPLHGYSRYFINYSAIARWVYRVVEAVGIDQALAIGKLFHAGEIVSRFSTEAFSVQRTAKGGRFTSREVLCSLQLVAESQLVFVEARLCRGSFLLSLVSCFPFIRAFLQRVVCRRLAARFYSLSPLKP